MDTDKLGEEILINLEVDHDKGSQRIAIYPEMGLVAHSLTFRGGLFSSGSVETDLVPMSQTRFSELSRKELRELDEDPEQRRPDN